MTVFLSFSRKGVQESRSPERYLNLLVQARLFYEKMNVYLHFAAILEHSGQLKKLGLELL